VTITQVKPIRAAFTLPERELPRIRTAMLRKPPPTVRVLLPGTETVLATGRIDFLDSSVDTASGTIVAKSNFANEDLRLWPGMYVDVQVDLDQRPDTITVPSPAVQIGQNGSYVYVVKSDKTVEARQVTVLGAEGDRTAIETGLKPGEHVVVDGQLRIGPGTRVTESTRGSAAGSQNEAAVHRDDHS
jgi:multidrug efflux system membrane fusion protein